MHESKSPSRVPLGGLVSQFLTEMYRYDGGRTLPILHASKLTTPQLAVLEFARFPCTVSAAAEHVELSRPATSQLVQKLVERGFLRRSENSSDRRERLLALTAQGEILLGAIAAARAARFEATLAAVPAPVAARLGTALQAAIEALAQVPERDQR